MDILFASFQVLCLGGYLYGACVAIGYGARIPSKRDTARAVRALEKEAIEENVYLRRYAAFDA